MSGPLSTIRLCLLGFGSVAQAFCELLEQQEQALATRHGLRVLITAVGTRRGSLWAPEGLTGGGVLAAAGASGTLPDPPLALPKLLAGSNADILVELTVMEHGGAETATGHIRAAFALGMDVVTANKGPIAWSWPEVAERARATRRRIRFESTVMDGLPVFSLLERTLPDCRLLGFEAIFNSTTNAIIDAIGEGVSFADALAQAQAAGYAEADPAHDIDGWDAACKAAALANVAMGAQITPAEVERQSLNDVPPERILRARANGERLRLVTSVWREPGAAGASGAAPAPVRARIEARELTIDHPLAALGGESLGICLHTDLMGDLFVAEIGALVPQTAYGVYADLLALTAAL